MKRAIATRPACPPEYQPADCPFMMMTLVRLRLHGKAALQGFCGDMDRLPEVLACIQLAGEFDFLLQVILPDPQAYEAFLAKKLCPIPAVEKVQSALVLKAWKLAVMFPAG